MPTQKDAIILHNYPQSPVAEKVRVALGIKQLVWHSVEIPRLPPKPKLTKLTGGYRRTPVMQIGADIYCDSQRILQELDRRFPAPRFYPAEAGMMKALSRWLDGRFFELSVKLVLGAQEAALPPEFAEDRGRLYFGPDWANAMKQAHGDLPHLAAQMRAALFWFEEQLSDGRTFVQGSQPGAVDAQLFHVVWFVRGRWEQGAAFLSEFPSLELWYANVEAIGHGTQHEMDSYDAITVAAKYEPEVIDEAEMCTWPDPQGLESGAMVTISPDVDGGEQPVEGQVVCASAEAVTLLRETDDLGRIHVHFPRAGYKIAVV